MKANELREMQTAELTSKLADLILFLKKTNDQKKIEIL